MLIGGVGYSHDTSSEAIEQYIVVAHESLSRLRLVSIHCPSARLLITVLIYNKYAGLGKEARRY
jgi:hypothetical protein